MSFVEMERLVAIVQDQASLDHIVRPDAALAIWWRRVSEPLQVALNTLDLDVVDDLSVEIDANESVDAALHCARYPEATLPVLSADVDLLVQRYAALTGNDRLRVRLEVIEADANSSFHSTYVTLRLLCTYIGPGTQWCCVEGQDAICEVPTGAVGVFKGRMLLNPPAILHRSPLPAAVGGRCLVLTIDTAHDLAKSKIAFS
jgi:hypothetical protein